MVTSWYILSKDLEHTAIMEATRILLIISSLVMKGQLFHGVSLTRELNTVC